MIVFIFYYNIYSTELWCYFLYIGFKSTIWVLFSICFYIFTFLFLFFSGINSCFISLLIMDFLILLVTLDIKNCSWFFFFGCSIIFFFFPFFKNFILFLNFTILYWFCQISKWIRHRYTCVPHPEPSSLLPPHTIPLGRPSAPAPSIQF